MRLNLVKKSNFLKDMWTFISYIQIIINKIKQEQHFYKTMY